MFGAWEILKKLEPLCWYGYGLCAPEVKEKGETIGGAKPTLLSLEGMGMEFKPNWDKIFILTLAIIISSLTTLIVSHYYFFRQHGILGDRRIILERLPEPEHERNNADENPRAPSPTASPHSLDINNNNAEAVGESSSILDLIREWAFEPEKNGSIAPVNSMILDFEPPLSMAEIRNKAVIERVPSANVKTVRFSENPNSGKRLTVRSLTKFRSGSEDPILVLHQNQRNTNGVVYGSIESLKLETIIRLCGIPHIVIADADHEKGPGLSYSGISCFGMENCMDLLHANFPTAFQSCQVSLEHNVPAHYIKILAECNLRSAILAWRSYHVDENSGPINFDYVESGPTENQEKKELQNYFQFCHKEFDSMNPDHILLEIEKDLDALSLSLGNKYFFTGDRMTILDSSVFALLAQFMYVNQDQYVLKRLIQKHPNLIRFCDVIREHIWNDWEPQSQ